jgi:hypothetical protein
MLITFTRIGTEPQWKTELVGLGFSSAFALGAGLTVFLLLVRPYARRVSKRSKKR